MKSTDVVVAGDLYVDLILSGFDSWLEPGRETFAREFAKDAGGGAAITGCGLAKLSSRVEAFGVAGASDSEWLLARLRECGVDTGAVQLHPFEPTAFTVVASTATERGFLTYPGANRALPEAVLRAARQQAFAHARHVHLAYPVALESAQELVDSLHRCDCSVSLDVGWHPKWMADARALELLRRVDLFFPNEVEGLRLTGTSDASHALECFAQLGLRKVALKLGAKGAALLWDGQVFEGAPPRVTPVDVTGAGDAFNAGFLYAWLGGHSPEQCLAAGNLCGALSTEAYGGIAGLPGAERFREYWP